MLEKHIKNKEIDWRQATTGSQLVLLIKNVKSKDIPLENEDI